MTDLIRPPKPGHDSLIGDAFGNGPGSGITLFTQDFALISLYIAGTRFHQAIAHIDSLQIGDILEMLRQPHNRHDPRAIALHTSTGLMLGYVPRENNEILANLMDAGKLLIARVDQIKRSEPHPRTGYDPGPSIHITILLRDF